MPRTPEYRASEPATLLQQKEIDDCYKHISASAMSAWDVTFISDMKGRLDNSFTVLLSEKQAHHLERIWTKLYDEGLVV